METKDIVKQAKILNWIEIIVTIVMYVAYKMFYTMAKNAATVDEINSIIGIETVIRFATGIFSIVVIILTAVLMKKNQKRVQGLGLLLASGIITLVFAILGITLNIVMWCLCGASLSKLKKAGQMFSSRIKISRMLTSKIRTSRILICQIRDSRI